MRCDGASGRWVCGLFSLLLAALLGCGQDQADAPKPEDDNGAEVPAEETGAAGDAQPEAAAEQEPPPPPTIPEVQLTETDLAKCRLGVGDAFPVGELPDLGGEPHSLSSLYGEKLTVVCFWTSKDIYALAELEELMWDVVEPFGDKGVAVVGINVGEEPAVVREKVEMTGADYPILLDADGSFYAQISTAQPPQTYLLDDEGKILWFDIEYSQGTRRDLLQAIRVALGEI
jgi:peroxiredoxin